MKRPILIRDERERDETIVFAVNASAFETDAEARLVDLLREQAQPIISLVAEVDDSVVGHIMFSPVVLSGDTDLPLMGLAPMAVAPKNQNQGIGSALVRAGLERCEDLGATAVAVLGHPAFYPRFGFMPSTHFGITCEYDAPAEAFMILELRPGSLRGKSGTITFHEAFAQV